VIGNLSRRERTIVTAGVVVALLIGAWSFVIEPILERTRTAAEMVPARALLLQRKRDLVARKGAINAELEAMTKQVDALSGRLLISATPAVAASELQKLVKEMATAAATQIRSERILPPAERGDLLEIPVEVSVSGEIRELVELLARLDAAPKLLSVQELRIRVVNVSQPRELLATVTLSGFILPGKAKT